MTPAELDKKYTDASWLIAKRSASAAGKALLFNSESMEDTVRDIANIYGLHDTDVAALRLGEDEGVIANVQHMAHGLLGEAADPNSSQAMKLARTAIQNGQAVAAVATLVKAGPKAAHTVVAAGGHAATKGTPWGWIATVGYAVGSAGWFAYNARAFNLSAFELVRRREGIELVAEPLEAVVEGPIEDSVTLAIRVPTVAAIAARATGLTSKASSAVGTLFGKLRGLRA